MKSYQDTIQRLRDFADAASLSDALSRAVHTLDALDKAIRRDTEALLTARLVTLLDGCRKAAPRAQRKAGGDDPHLRFALDEIGRLQTVVDARVKRLLLQGGGVRIGEVGIQKWASETVRAADAAKKPAARPTPPPAPKRSALSQPRRAAPPKAKSRGGVCVGCGKRADHIAQPSNLCTPCIDRMVDNRSLGLPRRR